MPAHLPLRPWPTRHGTLSAILMKRLQPSQEASCSLVATLWHTSRTRVLVPTSSIWAEKQRVTIEAQPGMTHHSLELFLLLKADRTCRSLRRSSLPFWKTSWMLQLFSQSLSPWGPRMLGL